MSMSENIKYRDKLIDDLKIFELCFVFISSKVMQYTEFSSANIEFMVIDECLAFQDGYCQYTIEELEELNTESIIEDIEEAYQNNYFDVFKYCRG